MAAGNWWQSVPWGWHQPQNVNHFQRLEIKLSRFGPWLSPLAYVQKCTCRRAHEKRVMWTKQGMACAARSARNMKNEEFLQ